MMVFLVIDLTSKRAIFENDDVKIQMEFKPDSSASYICSTIGSRKEENVELEPGFTIIFGPTKKVICFLKIVVYMHVQHH